MSSPQMPANIPIAQQRVVRGEAVRRLPGKGFGPDLPRFSNDGLVDVLATTPGHPMDDDMQLREAIVLQRVAQSGLEFDILVNEVVIDSVAASALYIQRYDIDVPVLLNDAVAIEITDFGTGLAEKVTITLRPFVSPAIEV